MKKNKPTLNGRKTIVQQIEQGPSRVLIELGGVKALPSSGTEVCAAGNKIAKVTSAESVASSGNRLSWVTLKRLRYTTGKSVEIVSADGKVRYPRLDSIPKELAEHGYLGLVRL